MSFKIDQSQDPGSVLHRFYSLREELLETRTQHNAELAKANQRIGDLTSKLSKYEALAVTLQSQMQQVKGDLSSLYDFVLDNTPNKDGPAYTQLTLIGDRLSNRALSIRGS